MYQNDLKYVAEVNKKQKKKNAAILFFKYTWFVLGWSWTPDNKIEFEIVAALGKRNFRTSTGRQINDYFIFNLIQVKEILKFFDHDFEIKQSKWLE